MTTIGQGRPGSPLSVEWPSNSIVLEALSRFVPPVTINSVLAHTKRQSRRIRRLPAAAVGWLVIAIGQLPPRDNRINPRVVKKKMSNFAKKRVEHYNLPQPQRPFEQSVVILK